MCRCLQPGVSVRITRSSLALTLTAILALVGCSRHVFEPVPSSPEAILAFRLRTLERGRMVRIQLVDGSRAEGEVVAAGPDLVVLGRVDGIDTVAAEAVSAIWMQRAGAGRTVGRTAVGAALSMAIVLVFAYGVSELTDPGYETDQIPLWYLAPLVAKAAFAGGVLGAAAYASSPAWNPIYPMSPGGRP